MNRIVATGFAQFAETSVGDAFSIALTGMLIVFVALGLISLFLALSPRLIGLLDSYFPPSEHGHAHVAAESDSSQNDDEVLAAIGYVLHTESVHNQ